MARAASELPGTEIPDADGRRRVVIENVRPRVDNGRFAVKRVAGDVVQVTADVFADGHDAVAAVVRHRREGERRFRETPMRALGNDRYSGAFAVAQVGRHVFTVRGWIDRFATWRDQLDRRVEAGQDVRSELLIGAAIIQAAMEAAPAAAAGELAAWRERLLGTTPARAPPRPSTPPSRSSWRHTTRGRTASIPTCR